MFGALSSSDIPGTYTPTEMVSIIVCYLALFGNSSISHTQIVCQLRPEAFVYPNINEGVRVYCVAGELSAFVLTRGVYSRFCPFSLKIAPEGVYSRGIKGIASTRTTVFRYETPPQGFLCLYGSTYEKS